MMMHVNISYHAKTYLDWRCSLMDDNSLVVNHMSKLHVFLPLLHKALVLVILCANPFLVCNWQSFKVLPNVDVTWWIICITSTVIKTREWEMRIYFIWHGEEPLHCNKKRKSLSTPCPKTCNEGNACMHTHLYAQVTLLRKYPWNKWINYGMMLWTDMKINSFIILYNHVVMVIRVIFCSYVHCNSWKYFIIIISLCTSYTVITMLQFKSFSFAKCHIIWTQEHAKGKLLIQPEDITLKTVR
jgi:hypothetical protein